MKKLVTLFFLISISVLPFSAVSGASGYRPKALIPVTPPAPVPTNEERWSELARRRAEVAKQMADNSILVLFSAEPKLYANDVNYVYRQENNLYYLTGLKQDNATLVIVKDGGTVNDYLFVPKRNPAREAWNGKMYSNDEVMTISGLKTIVNASELDAFLSSVKAKTVFSKGGVSVPASLKHLYLLLPENNGDDDGKKNYSHEFEWAKELANITVDPETEDITYATTSGYNILNAQPIFASLRLVKSPYELKMLQHAIDISTEAHLHGMAAVGQAKWEYEVQAEVEYIFRLRNADFWGYPSIVGCGANATTLHYEESQGPVKPGDVLLMDVGAEYEHYSADVTRTFPVNGKFSKKQAEIYRIVYDAQEAAAKAAKPGASLEDIENASANTVATGLAKLGLITAADATFDYKRRDGTIMQLPQVRLWFIHGNSHWLGMNVHDVGDYSTVLKPGMTFTNEPGIYLREDSLDYVADTPANRAMLERIRPAYESYKNIGVRIEDDMLITNTGVEWMTSKLPRKLEDVEAFMAAARRKMRA